MIYLTELWGTVMDFMETGGDVLWIIAIVLVFMWWFIIERLWFMSSIYPAEAKTIMENWHAREDTTSWYAHRIRDAWISEAHEHLSRRLGFIKTLVALCPLVGLLGTVTGMIAVFETMAVQGTGNARLMASGISMATIPTMAGMVAALSGIFVTHRLESRARIKTEQLADSMPHH